MTDVNCRIVCLSDECTDILYRLGQGERVVGISAYTTRPLEAVRDKPKVSGFEGGSIAKIKALQPDLVIGFSEVQARLAAELIGAGLNVLIMNQRTLAGIMDAITTLARLVGAEDEGQGLVQLCKAAVEQARVTTPVRRPRVYFEEWHRPLIAGINWVSELIELAGGEDVFAHISRRPLSRDRHVTPEDVIAAAPEIVLASWCGVPFDRTAFEERPGFSTLPAVHLGRVHEVDPAVFLAPGPTAIVEGLPMLRKLFEGS